MRGKIFGFLFSVVFYAKKYKETIYAAFSVATVVIIGMLLLWVIIDDDEKAKQKRESDAANAIRTEQAITLSRDSLSAFMSVIIEANQTLVNDPKSCRWLVLAEVKQPCYAMRHGHNWSDVKLEKPSSSRVYIWIPVDSITWSTSSLGDSLEKTKLLYIGRQPYTGDLQHVSMKITDKRDRGF